MKGRYLVSYVKKFSFTSRQSLIVFFSDPVIWIKLCVFKVNESVHKWHLDSHSYWFVKMLFNGLRQQASETLKKRRRKEQENTQLYLST